MGAARRYREILNDGRAGRREGQVGTAKVAGGTAANAALLHGAKKFNKGVLKVQKGVGIATAAVGIKANTVLKHGVKKVNHGVKKVLKGVGAAKVAAGIALKKHGAKKTQEGEGDHQGAPAQSFDDPLTILSSFYLIMHIFYYSPSFRL